MVRNLLRIEGVRGVHDLHVWSITQNMRALSAHILTDDIPISAGAAIQRQLNDALRVNYGIAHATLQLECAGCEPDLLYCELGVNSDDEARPAQPDLEQRPPRSTPS
jgi:cobalt-zinc-cadmium efflux system protein